MRIPAFFKSIRFFGLLGVAAAGYLLIFVILGNIDVSWMVPSQRIADALREAWPDMPFFTVQKEPADKGREEVLYTVPTRQLTPADMARMGLTNGAAKPVRPK